jgi:predicted deacylase
LEIIRVGNPDAQKIILLRARAHAWEPGGNWVIEGLVNGFIRKSQHSDKLLNKFCYYILPMANKDMTARGMTRFNVNGMDLNRGWGSIADSTLNPENYFLEKFLRMLINEDRKPDLLIDFHNDDYGNMHVSKPKDKDPTYQKNIEKIYQLLKDKTWFSGNMQKVYTEEPERYTIATGLYERYNITGFVLELNGDRIKKRNKLPSSEDWMDLGENLNDVFVTYFE